jgi:hypothetical protein
MRRIAIALLLLAGCSTDTTAWTDGKPADPSPPLDDQALQRAEHASWLAEGTLHRCDFSAYTLSREPVQVRMAPTAGARAAGKLPGASYDPDLGADVGTDIDVIEARDGWFRIRSHEPELQGWIPGRYIEFDLQTDKAFAAPDSSAAVVATSWDTAEGRTTLTWNEPSDCKGHWVKALFAGQDRIERSGWAAGVCANQYTTCDGVYGEWLPNGN